MSSVIDDDPAHPPSWHQEPFGESATGQDRHLGRYFSEKGKEKMAKKHRGGEGGNWHVGLSRKHKVVVDLVGCRIEKQSMRLDSGKSR